MPQTTFRPMPTKPLHSKEAAAWLGISKKKLLEFARAGMIGKKVGGTWFFSMESLCDFSGVPYDPQNFQN